MSCKRKQSTLAYSSRHKRRLIDEQTKKELGLENLSSARPNIEVRPASSAGLGPVPIPSVSSHDGSDSGSDCSLSSDILDIGSCCSEESVLECNRPSPSSDCDEGCRPSGSDLKTQLAEWAITYNVNHNAVSSLLCILRNSNVGVDLPKDARSLLKTPRNIEIKCIEGGQYWHYGLANVLNLMYRDLRQSGHEVNCLDLIINIDGLPLAKSSSACFWPILISEPILKKVYVSGCFYGYEKPTYANEFLQPFVNDINRYISCGFPVNDKPDMSVINVQVYALVCDVPAKSYLLQVKGHSGYDSCTKCSIHGVYKENRVCFPTPPPSDRPIARTDASVANMTDDDFHVGESILKTIPNFGLVSKVPLEYMHLVCLGVVKKLLLLWLGGPLQTRLSGHAIKQISSKLVALQKSTPGEFERKPRGLQHVKQWKATECRQFLLYTGPVVLKQFLREDIFKNFLSLHVAITLLIKREFASDDKYLEYANKLLIYFVNTFGILYGDQNISHNVHGLLHLTSDVKVYGSLDNYSAFRFESYLFELKKKLRKSERPLVQLAKRCVERERLGVGSTSNHRPNVNILKGEHCCGPLSSDLLEESGKKQFTVFHGKSMSLNCKDEKNSTCMLHDSSVIRIKNIVELENHAIVVLGSKHKILTNLYTLEPFESQDIGIKVVGLVEELEVNSYQISDIKCKMWKMQYNGEFVVFPLHDN